MTKYGQYCPVAKALEVVGDRWTLLIMRDMLLGTHRFNDLERGLPGISRALLASRLRQLQRAGLIEKGMNGARPKTTTYQPTQAGRALFEVIGALRTWGEAWAFGDPTPEELDPVLLMWWMRNRAEVGLLPEHRVVAQFDLSGAATMSFWLILSSNDVTLCLTDPGYEINLLVTADLAVFYKVWGGRLSYQEALSRDAVRIEGVPSLVRAFPSWFGWSGAISTRSTRAPALHA